MKSIATLRTAALLVLMLAAPLARAGDLVVEVKGIAGDAGDIMVAVYDQADSWLKRSVRSDKVAAKTGSVTLTFISLPPGDYAVVVYHDKNSNGKLDSNFIGIPTEPYGFSNNAVGSFGPAKFDQAKFKVGNTRDTISISLK